MKSDFYALAGLTKRGIKIFLKDKAGVFFSLLAPLIVLMLYVIFLGDVQLDSLKAYLSGAEVPEALAKAFVDGWMLAGVLSVACITVPFSAQSILVRDRESGNMSDMLVSPIKRHIVGLSYLTSVFAVSLCICFAVLIVAFVYLALTGWYLSVKDVLGIVGLTALSALFAALLSVIICSFISTQGAHGAFTGILSAAIGFLVGAYAAIHVSEGCAFRRAVAARHLLRRSFPQFVYARRA